VTSACASIRERSFAASSSCVAACRATSRCSTSLFFCNRSRLASAFARSPATLAASSISHRRCRSQIVLRLQEFRLRFRKPRRRILHIQFQYHLPLLNGCPSVARTFSTNVSSCARITYGAIGSTFPLLLMDETRFSRVGSTTETLALAFARSLHQHVRQNSRQHQVEQYSVSQLTIHFFLFCALPHFARRKETSLWRSVSLAYPWLSWLLSGRRHGFSF